MYNNGTMIAQPGMSVGNRMSPQMTPEMRKRAMMAQALRGQAQQSLAAPQQTLGHGLAAGLSNAGASYQQNQLRQMQEERMRQMMAGGAGGMGGVA
jgi:hypothetical protein